jgi:hypothetical protein
MQQVISKVQGGGQQVWAKSATPRFHDAPQKGNNPQPTRNKVSSILQEAQKPDRTGTWPVRTADSVCPAWFRPVLALLK